MHSENLPKEGSFLMNQVRMLLVDAKSMTVDLDRAGYRKMGVQVKHVHRFDDCMNELSRGETDVVVINLDYPKVQGIDAIQHLKTISHYKNIPIIATTVQTTQKIRNAAIQAGVDLFVEQPIPRTFFVEKMKEKLAQKTRGNERVIVKSLTGSLKKDNGSVVSCFIQDLSTGGALIEFDNDEELAKIDLGAKITLKFRFEQKKKPEDLHCEVMRLTHDKDNQLHKVIGVKFLDLTTDITDQLNGFVQKLSDLQHKMKFYQ